nr:extracellular solute-binding protein [Paenibacillus camelliae]
MRISTKKTIRYVAGILFIFILLSSCMSQRTNNDEAASNEQGQTADIHVYEDIGLSKYDPPIEVSFIRDVGGDFDSLISSLPGETLENNRWSRLYKQILGIDITYAWTAKDDFYRQKLNYAISSGQLPDIVKVSPDQLRALNNAGLIQDLTEVYEQYATPLTKTILSQEGSGPFDAATFDGRLMAIPETGSSIEGAMYIWVRMDWLERLGLQSPRTMEDILKISKAFTELDPDQNGVDDTFGLALTNYLWDPVMGAKGFIAGYHAYPEIWIEDEHGQLVYGGIQPEVKNALKVLQEMYINGELDPEFSFKNGNKVKQQIRDGKIGIMYGEQWGSFLVQSSRETDENADWKAFPIVSVNEEPAKVPLKFSTWQFLAVRKGFEYPEAVVKLFNLHLEKNWGVTADFETYYSSPYPVWQLSPVTPYPVKKNLNAYRQLNDARRSGDWSMLNPEAKSIQKLIDTYLNGGANSSAGWGWEKTYGEDSAFSILDQYERDNLLLYEKYTGVQTETMIEAKSMLHDLQHETYINIILGDPIESFDAFVDTWYKLGGAAITQEVNEWYSQSFRE